MILPSVMVNILGADDFTGDVKYKGIDEILKMKNSFLHIYGKKQTKPGRKMGHVTIMSSEKKELPAKAEEVKKILIEKT
jgi:5-(carboxyamino)imidazole ribonucleotide synthase